MGLIEPLTWERLLENERVHRLKRGKHFRGDVRDFANLVPLEAARRGKAARVMRDEFGKLQYLWVQVADYQIPVGAACPRCGGLRMLRMHDVYGRCAQCQATFILHGDLTVSGSGAARGPRDDIGLYTDVRLRFLDRRPGVERWAGHGTADGVQMLLIVDYALDDDDARIEDDTHPGEFVHRIHRFPLDPFSEAIDLDAMFAEQEARPGTAPPGDA